MGKENVSHKLSQVDWYSAGNITLQICKIKIFLYSEWKSLGLALLCYYLWFHAWRRSSRPMLICYLRCKSLADLLIRTLPASSYLLLGDFCLYFLPARPSQLASKPAAHKVWRPDQLHVSSASGGGGPSHSSLRPFYLVRPGSGSG